MLRVLDDDNRIETEEEGYTERDVAYTAERLVGNNINMVRWCRV